MPIKTLNRTKFNGQTKVDRYRSELIKHWGQYVSKGLLTTKEVEFIVNGAIVQTMCNARTRKLFVEDK